MNNLKISRSWLEAEKHIPGSSALRVYTPNLKIRGGAVYLNFGNKGFGVFDFHNIVIFYFDEEYLC